jgi:hypothetical protein
MMHTIDTKCGVVSISTDGIARITITPGTEIDEEGAIQFINAVESLAKRKVPLLITAHSHSLNVEAMATLSETNSVSAVAIVVDSILGEKAGKFFVDLAKPVYRMEVFESEHEAINWLLKFL